jgi:5'-nucleotidase/UDP-sugar diphosphatase
MKHSLSRRDFLRSVPIVGAASLLAACSPAKPGFESLENESLRHLVLLYTNDEHGWLEQGRDFGGADSLMYKWLHQERIGDHPDHVLILSGGDLYTGPALSTWFEGESTIDIMNTMGYQAAAIGNHDFDYGLENLQRRSAQAKFPFISANIRQKSNGAVPSFAHPYWVQAVNGVKIGLTGLTTRETPVDTKPAVVADLEFLHYERALKEVVPQVRQAGADLVLVLGHLCTNEIRALAPLARQLDIPILFGGHCHEVTHEVLEDVTLIQSGSFMHGYTKLELLFDKAAKKVVDLEVSFHDNQPGKVDKALAERILSWRAQTPSSLWERIGYTRQKISRTSVEMGRLLGQAWLSAVEGAQVALAESRYIQSLPAGEITPAEVISMLATDDVLVNLALTGAQLEEVIDAFRPLVGGLVEKDVFRFSDGQPLQPEAVYRVLVPDDIYEGCQGYPLKQMALSASNTGLGWREPVIDWIAALKTSRLNPLEKYLNSP